MSKACRGRQQKWGSDAYDTYEACKNHQRHDIGKQVCYYQVQVYFVPAAQRMYPPSVCQTALMACESRLVIATIWA